MTKQSTRYITYADIDPPDWYKPGRGKRYYLWINYETRTIWMDKLEDNSRYIYDWGVRPVSYATLKENGVDIAQVLSILYE